MTYAPSLPRSTPEAQGISSAAISAFLGAADRDLDAIHSFMLLRHGHVVAEGWWEPYQPHDPHMLFSLSKSFTSSAIGLLVTEGSLSVDDSVLGFFPDDAPPEPGANLKAMRVRHLLSMTTGHAIDTTAPMAQQPDRSWVQGFLAQPVEYAPGTHFVYNSGATYMLSAIVQKLSGGRMRDYLMPRLFTPLGIKNPQWETSPQGIDTGGWGLSITTADIASFGQMYLQKGIWQGTRILPESWVEQATSRQVPNDPAPNPDWEQGYGYQFWRCRHDAYRGDGAFGQYCVVMPAQDAVLAITSGLSAMQPPLDLVWKHLLPAMSAAPLPENDADRNALIHTLAHLQLRTPEGQQHSATAAHVSGKRFVMGENAAGITAMRFDFGADEMQITLHDDMGEQQIACGNAQWVRATIGISPPINRTRASATPHLGPWNVAASGAWTDNETYTVKLWYHETPFARTLACHFAGDRLTVEQQGNVGFGPVETMQLTGQVAL